MLEKKEGVVAILDVLGFKEMLKKDKPNKIYNNWSSIKKQLNKQLKLDRKIEKEIGHPIPKIDKYFFSDTIVLFSEICDLNEMFYFYGHVGNLFNYSMLKKGIFFRGAISYGEYYAEKDIFLGSAIADAGEWHDQADWAGLMITPKTSFLIKKESQTRHFAFDSFYYSCPVPLRLGRKVNCCTVAWPMLYCWETGFSTVWEPIKKLRIAVNEAFSKRDIGKDVFSKYQNTYDYMEEIINFYENIPRE